MSPLRSLVLSLLSAAASSAAYAAEPPKWIIYGFMSDGKGGHEAVFFDQAGLKRQPGNHVQVWIKSLSTKKLDHLSDLFVTPPKKGSPEYEDFISVVRSSLIRMKSGEPLLYESVSPEKVNQNAHDNMILYEAIANSGTLQAHVKILYEVDCANDVLRHLSFSMTNANGGVSTDDTPETWQHISPESNGSRLEALVCKPQ